LRGRDDFANLRIDSPAARKNVQPDLTVVVPKVRWSRASSMNFETADSPFRTTQEIGAARTSKIYSKEFMRRVGIPTARFARVESVDAAIGALAQFEFPVVIKPTGSRRGRESFIAQNRMEAETAIHGLGPRLIIEEFLQGEEVSFIVMSDGRNFVALEATQDHKPVCDGDSGPEHWRHGRVLRRTYFDGSAIAARDRHDY